MRSLSINMIGILIGREKSVYYKIKKVHTMDYHHKQSWFFFFFFFVFVFFFTDHIYHSLVFDASFNSGSIFSYSQKSRGSAIILFK